MHPRLSTLLFAIVLLDMNSLPAAETNGLASADGLRWTDAVTLGVEGKGWTNTRSFFDRLPARAEGMVRQPVWDLSRNTAGLCVRFVTDAPSLHARWVLSESWLYLPNATAIAKSGLDLYVRTGSGWRWLAVGTPAAQSNEVRLIENLIPGKREYLLYLPLYNGVTRLEIGVPAKSTVEPAEAWGPGQRKPIVFYGTSITQGLSASRPGMVHCAMLGRRFNWPTINLGFSGNGKMEPEMAELLAGLDPSIYVLDCLPNLVAEEIETRVEPFVRRLRSAHPQTPIILVEDRTLQDSFLIQGRMEWYHNRSRAALRGCFERLQKAGVPGLHYIEGEHLLGSDGEGTVDASHPNDLGFMRQAEVFARVIEPLLRSE